MHRLENQGASSRDGDMSERYPNSRSQMHTTVAALVFPAITLLFTGPLQMTMQHIHRTFTARAANFGQYDQNIVSFPRLEAFGALPVCRSST